MRSDTCELLAECAREPIHMPGSIQRHGSLLVAHTRDLIVRHASVDLAPLALDHALADLLGRTSVARIEVTAAAGSSSMARILSAHQPGSGGGRDVVAHLLGELLYVELEPAASGEERDQLIGRTHEVIQSLRRCQTVDGLCGTVARELKALTGYDRVMVYKFDAEGHGQVVAEERCPELEPYLDLRYPASDIPAQARSLYLQQRVRMIGGVNDEPLPVASAPSAAPSAPLDLSYCGLRSASPIHLQYMRNMGVGASLVASLILEGRLWGMLICHHRGPRYPSAHLRAVLDLIAQVTSMLIGASAQAELAGGRLARQILLDELKERARHGRTVAFGLLERSDDLLRLVGASGALVRLGSRTELIGETPGLAAASAIMTGMRARSAQDVIASHALGREDAAFAAHARTASGALTLPILHGPDDAITWFRPEVVRTVTWGGDPRKAVRQENGTNRLTPRASFAAWKEEVRGQAIPWTEVDIEAARGLRRVIIEAFLRQAEAALALAQLSHYDPLTGLPNRRLFQERLDAALASAEDAETALIFFDLDRFKNVNDSWGHAVGDEFLQQVAQRVLASVPDRHLVARLGGDEFVVLCQGVSSAEVQGIADHIVEAMRSPFQLAGKPFRSGASVGVAIARPGERLDLLQAADAAMYVAKNGGGNRAVRFDHSIRDNVVKRLQMEQDLFQAEARDEFRLHYQPLRDCRTGRVAGVEALLRWKHPRCGLVGPGEFIKVAEEADLIVSIGGWVLREAVRQLALWRARLDPSLTMSVNVSALQLAQPGFADQVRDALIAQRLPPPALILEVTESVLMQGSAVEHLANVRAVGVQVSIDDFGTGYSSLAYLQQLDIDEVKIDKLFLRRATTDQRAAGLLEALIRLGQNLGLRVVAEGVETPAQWRLLLQLGCDLAQGYWLSRPLEPMAAEHFLTCPPPLKVNRTVRRRRFASSPRPLPRTDTVQP